MSIHAATSLLFVPGTRPDRFAKALSTGADVVVVDLEDAVPPEEKDSARASTLGWLVSGGQAAVRINPTTSPHHSVDMNEISAAATALVLPKAEDPSAVARVCASTGPGKVVALIETCIGLRNAEAIAAVPGLARIAFGNVDLAAELGIDAASRTGLLYARSRIVAASTAAGLPAPVDGVTTAVLDAEQLNADIAHGREVGFRGKLCIHPAQVRAVNVGYAPTDAELTWATRIVNAAGSELGVQVVDGAMVDAPVVARARRLLERVNR